MLVRTELEKKQQPALHVFKLQIQLQVTFFMSYNTDFLQMCD